MTQKKKHLLQDFIFLLISIAFAVALVESGIAQEFIQSLDGYTWLGILLAGMFFTSVFTTAPAIALLAEFSLSVPVPVVALVGGAGAVLGDYVIFAFVKDRISKDMRFLFSFSKHKRFTKIFQTKLFRFFLPFLGALIIASPFPDEIGITLLGMSKMKDSRFFIVSFVMNTLGILAIGLIAQNL